MAQKLIAKIFLADKLFTMFAFASQNCENPMANFWLKKFFIRTTKFTTQHKTFFLI
jgi:hypothetical protein